MIGHQALKYLRLTRGQQSSAVLFLQFHTNEQWMQWLERSSQGPETRWTCWNYSMVVIRGCKTWWACKIEKSKSNTFIIKNISSRLCQCYCLSAHFTIRHISFFLKNARASCIFYIYLAWPPGKVYVRNSRLNTDHDPQDILLHCRMVNKIA